MSMSILCMVRITFSVRRSCRKGSDAQQADISAGDSNPKYGLDEDASIRCAHAASNIDVSNNIQPCPILLVSFVVIDELMEKCCVVVRERNGLLTLLLLFTF